MTKIEETDFYKSLSEYRQKIIKETWERWHEDQQEVDLDFFVKIYKENFRRQDEYRRKEREKWQNIEIKTYHVLDHPNDDPDGFKKLTIRPSIGSEQ